MQRLLEQLMLCINYTGLLESDVEEVVKGTRDYFKKEGFTISEGTHKNINLQVNDPSDKEEKITSSADTMRRFVFERDNICVGIMRDSIELTIAAGIDYRGFEEYKPYISYIMSVMNEKYSDILRIARIGIRKINSLFLKNLDTIGDYFNKNIFNCNVIKELLAVSNDKVLLSDMHLTVYNQAHKVNLATEIQIGEAQEIQNNRIASIEVYRAILDIDVYWDQELIEYTDIDKKLTEMNTEATGIYEKCLNSDFRDRLIAEIADQDDNIFGGVK